MQSFPFISLFCLTISCHTSMVSSSLFFSIFLIIIFYRFTREQVEQLDKNRQWSRALDGSDYLPGMVFYLTSLCLLLLFFLIIVTVIAISILYISIFYPNASYLELENLLGGAE